MKISTIRGNVAENSGGLRGLKYGVTRDYVMGLEVVLANGRGSRDRLGHYRRQDHPVHAGVFGPDHDEMRRGICPRGFRKSVARYANDVGNFCSRFPPTWRRQILKIELILVLGC